MPQTQLNPFHSVVRALFSCLYGTLPDLTNLSRIVLMSQPIYGFMDMSRINHAWITETAEDFLSTRVASLSPPGACDLGKRC